MAKKKKVEEKIITAKDVKENIITTDFSDEMKTSYRDYAVSVIAGRAFADVRDGLKPVQRRILYSMDELNLGPNSAYKKCARIVGDTMGKYHPHGDSSIYGGLVTMSKDWTYPYPLVDGHGNFGSIEGDGPAAMRYCVTGNTLISTDNGVIRIDNIVKNTELNSDNSIDLMVKNMYGEYSHASVLFNSGIHEVFKVTLRNGMYIKGTANHPLLIYTGSQKYVWKTIEMLRLHEICVIDKEEVENLGYLFNVPEVEEIGLYGASTEIISIEPCGEEVVYSIKVDEDHHSFVGNGFVNHNTEARLSPISKKYFFEDLEKNTVDFVPNFDESEKEPALLPIKIPNLLISGTEGIGCGMAAKIPSHNAGEVIDAIIAYMAKPKITIEELLTYIKGPDFATGGVIANKKDLLNMYSTGNGKIKVRGKVEIEEAPGGKQRIIVTEIPYTMIGEIDKFMESVAELVRNKKAPDIVDIINMSSKKGIRIVIELKKGADVQKNINILYKKTRLEDTFGMNLLAVKDNVPKVYNLKELIEEFIEFQFIIYERKYQYMLKKEKDILEIKSGLIKACDCIDLIIEAIRGSKTRQLISDCLMFGKTDGINFKSAKSRKEASKFNFTERQATAILAMRLESLIGLEIELLRKELEDCKKKIAEYEAILASKTKMKNKIASNLKDIRKDLSQERKTLIIDADEIVLEKEEIVEEDCVALVDRFGYIKIIDIATFERNKENVFNDYKYVIETKNTDKIFILTDNAKRHQIKVLDIPTLKYKEKGIPLENISNLVTGETVLFIGAESFVEKNNFIITTNNGTCKIVPGSEYVASVKTTNTTKLADDAKIILIKPVAEETELVFETKKGMYLRIKLSEVAIQKKNSFGVAGIKLKDNDTVVNCYIGNKSTEFINKDDKTVIFEKIKMQKRGTGGVKTKID